MKLQTQCKMLALAATIACGPAVAQVTLYEHDQFSGGSVRVTAETANLQRIGFNDRASSLVVEGGRWEVCEDARFSGRCVVLRRGQYDSLRAMGLDDRVSSLRAVSQSARNYNASESYLAANPDYRRRADERLYSVPVRDVRAVGGPPEQRCWIEQEQAVQGNNSGYNVPGAIVGAVIGGVLGHQIGGGRGQDVATAGGAVAGGAIGANVGRGGGETVTTRDVQRCAMTQQERPSYWDVSYEFRGVEHRVQMTSPPGPTITVNNNGEPRY
jgi:uncharacterized protein YcfJ